jgi:hypothetical protein
VLTTSPFSLRHVGVQRDDRLAGVDGDAHLQVEVRCRRAQLRHAVPDRQRRAHGPLRVVPVSDGRAEDPHHRVADELLDGSAAGLDLGPDALEVRRLDRPNVLGIEPFRAGGEADEIREENRDDLPFLARASLVRREAGATGTAELRVGRVLPTTARADVHALSVSPRAPV